MNRENSTARTSATAAVWFFYAVVSGIALGQSTTMEDWAITAIVLVAGLFALLTTLAMWVGGRSSDSHVSVSSEKAKRGNPEASKYALLIEMMDADERAAFKETLKRRVLQDLSINEDGELNTDIATLEALLDDQSERRYH